MSLPEKFDKALQAQLGARAVWLPGSPIAVGDIVVRRDDSFFEGGTLADFDVPFTVQPHAPINGLNMRSSRTKQSIFQLGAELSNIGEIADDIEAKVKFEFSRKEEFVLMTPQLTGELLAGLFGIAAKLSVHPAWLHNKYYIVEQTFEATDWSFLGTMDTARNFEISGKGAAIKGFLTLGSSLGISSTGNLSVEMMGAEGAIAMKLVRVRKDGTLNHS